MKKRFSIVFTVAVLLACIFGVARPALAWECEALTDHSWLCNEGDDYYFVEYENGRYIYTRF